MTKANLWAYFYIQLWRWMVSWCAVIDGIIGILTFGFVHTRFTINAVVQLMHIKWDFRDVINV